MIEELPLTGDKMQTVKSGAEREIKFFPVANHPTGSLHPDNTTQPMVYRAGRGSLALDKIVQIITLVLLLLAALLIVGRLILH